GAGPALGGGGASPRGRRPAPGRGGHGDRQEPGLPAARGGAGPGGGGLHRHQEPPGAAAEQGPPSPGPGPGSGPLGGGYEGPGELLVSAPLPVLHPGGEL